MALMGPNIMSEILIAGQINSKDICIDFTLHGKQDLFYVLFLYNCLLTLLRYFKSESSSVIDKKNLDTPIILPRRPVMAFGASNDTPASQGIVMC